MTAATNVFHIILFLPPNKSSTLDLEDAMTVSLLFHL